MTTIICREFTHNIMTTITCREFTHKIITKTKDFLEIKSIRNKNCLWWPCLLMDRDEMSNLYREPSIDASYQVSVHLAKQFQRRRFLKIGQSEIRIACGGHVC
jgi:hypothetical protein